MDDPNAPPATRYLRKIIRIRAEDSPNVRRALDQIKAGQRPTGQREDGTDILPGVLSWELYAQRRKTWSKERQCVGLDADFWKGAQQFCYPTEWLNLAERRWPFLPKRRRAKGIGCDPAEGGDETAMSAVDELGLIELVSRKTPRTDDIPLELFAFMKKHGVEGERVCIDRGGGGKHVADHLRRHMGVSIRTVAFGSAMVSEPRHGTKTVAQRREETEGRYEYKDRRAQLYYEFAELFDPGREDDGPRFALPPAETILRHEMTVIPKSYTKEGTLFLLPKHPDPTRPKETQQSLIQLIGWSPDRLDSVTLAVHAMLHEAPAVRIGAQAWG